MLQTTKKVLVTEYIEMWKEKVFPSSCPNDILGAQS